ncbi:MAG TPA: hypothetical protein VL400_19375 [Polyangiaceae bacterium]|nr:hypothetical protein [Polyangiaceae bacterium]
MFERFRRDLGRYFSLDSANGNPSLREKVSIVLRAPQLQAIAAYRFGQWVNHNVPSRALRIPLRAAWHVMDKSAQVLWGIRIHEHADIGGGLYIGHPGDLLIGPVKMGEDCNVSQHVVLGKRTDGRGAGGAPVLGDRVWIGVGALIYGDVHVGTGATIGPLTVVGRNVGPKTMVIGNPMQVLKRDYDNTLQIYGAPLGHAAGPVPAPSHAPAAASAPAPVPTAAAPAPVPGPTSARAPSTAERSAAAPVLATAAAESAPPLRAGSDPQ